MTTLPPRVPYSEEELKKLYPPGLSLELVQVFLRHGERTPVSARFENAGLKPDWPYCQSTRSMVDAMLTTDDFTQWGHILYRRRLETFADDDSPVLMTGPVGQRSGLCQPGELTDRGRQTTLYLGQHLRDLYVDKLKFMPEIIHNNREIYLRATPIARARQSMQQVYLGMFPPSARTADCEAPTIVQRNYAEETLYPNESSCRRFAQLARAFAQRAAARHNGSPEMQYVTDKIGKWIPGGAVAVDSHPRLSGIMDSVNASLAHGEQTRLPPEFYDEKLREIMDKVTVEEWFSGYDESNEYRMLGVGALAGDIVSRMVRKAEHGVFKQFVLPLRKEGEPAAPEEREADLKLALSGCHDTTLAGLLTSMGAFKDEQWPPFTSHIAFELFKKNKDAINPSKKADFWTPKFPTLQEGIARRPMSQLNEEERAKLDDYYVRIRYNDKVMQVPACKRPGNHLEGDETFCTLAAFKTVVDKFTPKKWSVACKDNLESPRFPSTIQPAGH